MAFNILIADDSETMRAVIKKVVTMSGVPVDTFFEAGNGRQALELLEHEWVDVILSDINMPEMTGIEFLRELKKTEVHKNVPVILITTESSQARIEEAKALGAAGYVKKPFLPETIKKMLDEVLEKAYNRMPAEEEGEMTEQDKPKDSDDGFDF